MYRTTAAFLFIMGWLTLELAEAIPVRHHIPLSREQALSLADYEKVDIELSLMGNPQPIRTARLIREETSPREYPSAARLFVVHLDPGLDFREDFRSRRWMKKLLGSLSADRDFVAVQRAGALSHFSSNRAEIERLIDFFGTEFDRFGFAPPRPRDRGWFQRKIWPFDPKYQGVPPDHPQPASLLERSIPGDLRDSLSSLRGLPGRKILLHFGRELPFREEQVEFHDPRSATRWAQEAGFTCYAIIPGKDYQTISAPDRRLESWVKGTGGDVLFETPELLRDLQQLLDRTSRYLTVEFDAPQDYGGGFKTFALRIVTPAGIVTSSGGYFDLVQSDASLVRRAFLTSGMQTTSSDLPLDLQAQPSQFRGVVTELRFPLEKVRFETILGADGRGQKIFQEINIFLGLYGVQDQLLAYAEDRFDVDLEENEIREFFPRNATLKRVLESRSRAEPSRLRAVVVVGQSRQIARGEIPLP